MNPRLTLVSLLLLLNAVATAAETAPTPPELAKLKDTYQAELKRVSDPVTLRYTEALKRLQESYTKSGQAEKALAVKAELDLLASLRAEGKTRLTDKDLDESRWTWGSGGILTLHRQNQAMHSAWNTPGTWKRLNDLSVLLTKSDGTKMTLTFTDGELASGEVISDTGAKTTLTRLPK